MERRLTFGSVAEQYDRHRPSYPAQLVDDVIELVALDADALVLEVGAGTGKATAMFASRGVAILAVEPSAEMLSVARRNCSELAQVDFEQSDFEHWDPSGRTFPLIFSAQAWHWVDPEIGYDKTGRLLSPRGVLAAFWNVPDWSRSDLAAEFRAAYARAAPDLDPHGLMHPASALDEGSTWRQAVAACTGLTDAKLSAYEWEHEYSVEEYLGLLATTSEILLGEGRRSPLFDEIAAVIGANGGSISLPMTTQLCLARAA